MEDATLELAQDLDKQYGDKVQVTYIDIEQKGLGAYPVIAQVMQMGYPLPIITINGEPRLAGGIDFGQIETILATIVNN